MRHARRDGRAVRAGSNQRVIGRMPDAGHPLVAAHRSHAAAHLGRQRLESEPVVSVRQSAGVSRIRSLRGLLLQQNLDRFLKPPLQQVHRGREGDQTGSR
jgi:hypothetical protein